MADATQELNIKLKGTLDIDTASAGKAGEKVGKEVKDGVEKITPAISKAFEKAITDPIRESKRMLAEIARDKALVGKRGMFDIAKANAQYTKQRQPYYKAIAEKAIADRNAKLHADKQSMYEDLFGKPTSLEKFISVMDRVKPAMSAFGDMLKSGAKSVFHKMADPIKETVKHLNGFFSAVKRIAVYRAIRWALKAITQSFQEGIQNAYQWSVVTGNQFAKSMDMMATSALYFKNSLGAMTMPLVNTLAPILDAIIDKFVALINVVNQFIATITGATSWTRALKYPKEYAEAVGGAAKEIKNQLLGFDELNILKAPSPGGGASALDYSSMFENVALSLKNLDFANKIKEAIKNQRWGDVGKFIAEKFNDMISSIDAKLFSEALGRKINHAISLVHSLLVEADFAQVGVKIGEFMTNLKLNWGKIAGSWVRWKTNILDTLLGLIEGVNWANVGKAIGDAIAGLFNEFASWLSSVDWYKKGQEFTQAIVDIISNVNWGRVARAIWQGLKGALEAALDLLTGAIGQIEFDQYGQLVSVPTPSSYSQTTGGAVGGALAGLGMFANGGFPTRGSMFIAGEQNGNPEYVGSINGRTGVYNADQMTAALANANEGMVNTLVSVGNAIVSAINRKETSININDIRRAMNSSNLRYGV